MSPPEYLHSRFVYQDDIPPYSLRNSANELTDPLPHTCIFEIDFATNSGTYLWSNLPQNVQQVKSLNEFSIHQLVVDMSLVTFLSSLKSLFLNILEWPECKMPAQFCQHPSL